MTKMIFFHQFFIILILVHSLELLKALKTTTKRFRSTTDKNEDLILNELDTKNEKLIKQSKNLTIFDSKLKEQLNDLFQKNELDPIFKYRLISDRNAYVIFDCDRPSYIKPGNLLVYLKNHVVNDEIERKKDPRITDPSAYLCDKDENIWKVNPEVFKSRGLIAFDDDKPAEADMNFITVADEKTIKDYFKYIDENKISDKVMNLAYKIIHHPKYYKIDKNKKPIIVDIFAEQDKKIPKWIRDFRSKQINKLYDQLTQVADNFSIPKHSRLKEDTFGDGYAFILFNCTDPTYLYPSKSKPADLMRIESREFKYMFSRVGYCSKNDNIWRSGKKPNRTEEESEYFLTYDSKGNGLGFSPSTKFLKILKIKQLCDDYMKYLYHPGYFLKNYKKPIECTIEVDFSEDEKKIKQALKDYNKKNKISNNFKLKTKNLKVKKTTKPVAVEQSDSIDSSDSGFFNSE